MTEFRLEFLDKENDIVVLKLLVKFPAISWSLPIISRLITKIDERGAFVRFWHRCSDKWTIHSIDELKQCLSKLSRTRGHFQHCLWYPWTVVYAFNKIYTRTSGQKISMKGCIAVLSPLLAANGFVLPWPNLTHDSLSPYESAPQTTSR